LENKITKVCTNLHLNPR